MHLQETIYLVLGDFLHATPKFTFIVEYRRYPTIIQFSIHLYPIPIVFSFLISLQWYLNIFPTESDKTLNSLNKGRQSIK